jgi:hypothetical protein
LEPRFLNIGEEVSGRYHEMVRAANKMVFKLSIGDQEIYLPKDVGQSLLKSHLQGNERFKISRIKDLYEIKPDNGAPL